jgi:N-acetylmuramoyl-L-alanine amidase
MQNRGVVEHSDMTGFNWSKVPVILVEMGFLSNPTEDKLLSSEDYESKLAEGLCNGISAAVIQ